MRGRAVRHPVAKAAPAGIFASLYNCLPDGFLGATGGGNQARVEMRTEVCMRSTPRYTWISLATTGVTSVQQVTQGEHKATRNEGSELFAWRA